MRTYVYLCTFAAAVTAVVSINDVCCRYFLDERFGMSAGKLHRLYRGDDVDEIPILGSSVPKCGIVPSELSPRCYNYAEDGMLNFEVFTLLGVVMRQRKLADAIILNLDPWWYSDNAERSWFRGDYVLVPESGMVKWIDALPGVRFFGRFGQALISWMRRRGGDEVVNGAVLRKSMKSAEQWKMIYANMDVRHGFKFNERADHALRDCLAMLGERKLVITALPCVGEFRRRYPTEKEFTSYLKSFDEIKNVFVVDLFTPTNAVPGLGEGDFFDHQHLNEKGAQKVSRVLRRRIQDLGVEL